MTRHPTPFLACTDTPSVKDAGVVVLPVPYEGGVSYGGGASRGPQAILEASSQVEYYDALLQADARHIGIATAGALETSTWDTPNTMDRGVEHAVAELVRMQKFVVTLGGDHSIAPPCVRVHAAQHGTLGVIQFDAHADLRPAYDDSPLSHACAMARIREITPHTLQLGIRSLCEEEAVTIAEQALDVFSVRQMRANPAAVRRCIDALPEQVYITIDVDGLDASVVWSTGTPEPGGIHWYEMIDLLGMIFTARHVVGVDVVELAPRDGDLNSAYAVARLVYHLIGRHAQAMPHHPS